MKNYSDFDLLGFNEFRELSKDLFLKFYGGTLTILSVHLIKNILNINMEKIFLAHLQLTITNITRNNRFLKFNLIDFAK